MENLWIIYARKNMSCYLAELERIDTLDNIIQLIAKHQEQLGPKWEIFYALLEP